MINTKEFPQVLTLVRSDLTLAKEKETVETLTLHDFYCSIEKINIADIILFIETNGVIKILKDRFNIDRLNKIIF